MDERRFDQVSKSLDHITRVFIERSYIFQEQSRDRIRPKDFEGVLLDNVLNWLFGQCATLHHFYRRKCMEMFMKMIHKSINNDSIEAYYERNLNVAKIIAYGEEGNGIVKRPTLEFLSDTAIIEPIFLEIYKWMKKLLTTLDFYVWVFKNNILPKDQMPNFLNKSVILTAAEHFLKNDVIQTINADSTQASYEMKMNNRNLDKIEVLRCTITMRIIDLFAIFLENGNINNFLTTIQYHMIKLLGRLIFKPQRLNFDHRTENTIHNLKDRVIKFIVVLVENSAIGTACMTKLQDKLIRYLHYFCQNCKKLFDKRTVFSLDESKLNGIDLIVTRLRAQLTENSSVTTWDLITKSFELFIQKLYENIFHEGQPKVLSPSITRFACHMMEICLKFNETFLKKIITYCLDDDRLEISNSNTITRGDHFLQIYKKPALQLFINNMNETISTLVTFLSNTQTTQMNRLRIINLITEVNKFIYNNRSSDLKFLEDSVHVLVEHWPHILASIIQVDNVLNRVDLSIIDFIKHVAMICPYDLHLIGQRFFDKFREWLLDLLKDKNYSLDIKAKGLFLLPCIVSPDNTRNQDDLTSALNTFQIIHFPLRSNEFSEGSVERAKHVAVLKTIFQALLTSRSPIIYRLIIDVTINVDGKFLLESQLQKTQKELMESLTEKQQEFILNQTFDLFLNANYDALIRINIVSRYLLTLMQNSHVETMLTFMKQRINQIWNLLTSKIDNSFENVLINGSGAFIMIEAFYASVPYNRIETSSFSYGGDLKNGKTMTTSLILKARDIRNDTFFHSNSDANLELLRRFHCYGYRALAVNEV